MLPFMAVMSNINDSDSSDIQLTVSSSNNRLQQMAKRKFDDSIFDRSGIFSVNENKSFDASVRFNSTRNAMPLISKREFIEQWLLTQSNSVHSETPSDCSSSSFISNSTKSKRVLRSPFRNCNEIKRFKSNNDRNKLSSLIKGQMDIGTPIQSKENRIVEKNKGTTTKIGRYINSEDIARNSSKYTSINFEKRPSNERMREDKIESYRGEVGDSTKKIMNQSLMFTSDKIIELATQQSFKSCKITPYQSPEHQIIDQVESQSPNITDIESLAPSSPLFEPIDDSVECESPRKLDIQSLPSSPRITNVHIDSESSDIIDAGQDAIVDNARDKMIYEVIDDTDANLSINNSECNTMEMSTISSVKSSDSDKTFFSQSNELDRTIIENEKSIELSQKISQDCVSLQHSDVKIDSTDLDIKSGISPPRQSSKLENSNYYPAISNPAVKRKRKPKKGSLVGRLQALITGQTSFLRIWRHQMAQSHLESKSQQCVVLKITRCASQYSGQYFVGLVISDKYNLLDKVVCDNNRLKSSDSNNDNAPLTKTVIVLTAPEIVGTINIKENEALEIYPPWEVIDSNRMVLSVLYFRIVINNNSSVAIDNSIKNNCKIIQKFDCPCMAEKQIVESCKTKFTNVKPNMMRYLFDD